MDFSLKDIVMLLIKNALFLTICTLLGLSILFLYTRYGVEPDYTASAQMYVSTEDSNQTTAKLSELDYAQKVVTTYINFLQTKAFYKKVLNNSGLNYTVRELRDMTTMESVNNTEIFEISVTSKDPNHSYHLVKSMQDLAPEMISDIKSKTEISVVDPVELPATPSGPNILLFTIVGGALGFIIAFLIAIILEVANVTIKGQEDLKNRFSVPILGVIPDFNIYSNTKLKASKLIYKLQNTLIYHKIQKSKTIDWPFGKKEQREKINNSKLDFRANNRFFITEAYKSLRTNLRFTLRNEGCKKLIICSPVPEDGKSTTSTNLAITIAQTNSRVLLIDCDLRKGRLHYFFKVKSSPGISDCLSGIVGKTDGIYKTSIKNLDLLPMGSIPPNPAELMSSYQMESLINNLEKDYDYIIMDTPPINVVSDSLSLVKFADGVILVIREKKTSYANIEGAISKFHFAKTNILGFVLNGASIHQGKGYKANYYYQGKNND
ncbi:MAG: polysaccharide biosynthesis tyrosine autokinase [Anaerocolumna sp.]